METCCNNLLFSSFPSFLQNEERALFDALANDFEEKLRKVEEERHSSEMYSGKIFYHKL